MVQFHHLEVMICKVRSITKLNRSDRKYKRNVAIKDPKPSNYLIVTEGIESI